MTSDQPLRFKYELAERFLKMLDPQATQFTFQTFDDDQTRKTEALARKFSTSVRDPLILESYRHGAGVYVTINETDGKGRKKENIVRIRAVWQEDDENFSGNFPVLPTLVVESSKGHFHRYWFVADHWPTDEQGCLDFEGVMVRMISDYGSDKNVKDISRVLRVPGFLNRKRTKEMAREDAVRIHEVHPQLRRYTRAEILAAFPPIARKSISERAVAKITPRNFDPSEIERARDAVRCINADDREVWCRIGMALRSEFGDAGRTVWDEWSRTSSKYDERDQDHKWRSFNGTGISIGTLYYHAQQSGYRPQRSRSVLNVERVSENMRIFDCSLNGNVLRTTGNLRTAIEELGITCRYDQFHDQALLAGKLIDHYAGELGDDAVLMVCKAIEERFGFDPAVEKARNALRQLCLENSFDPIAEYLAALEWDGAKRLARWLTTYLGSADTQLNRAIGKIALVAQVRRARQPACKFDQIIVLEGREGKQKSTALAVLAGAPENFSDQTILGKPDKEQQELLRGVWVYEIADLSNMARSEVEAVKAFASRQYDRARRAYGRTVESAPRRCVIWATTNNREYLKSQTGNRRFWIIETGNIDIEALRADRDQLLAEATRIEADDFPLILPPNLWTAAATEQEQRREAHPWEELLHDVKGEIFGDEERTLSATLLTEIIGRPRERQTSSDLKVLGDCMRTLGWEGPKQLRLASGKNVRGYCRKIQAKSL